MLGQHLQTNIQIFFMGEEFGLSLLTSFLHINCLVSGKIFTKEVRLTVGWLLPSDQHLCYQTPEVLQLLRKVNS